MYDSLREGGLGIIGAVISVFILMFIGYATKKLRLLRVDDVSVLSTIIVYLTLPCFVFEAIYNYRQPLPLSIAKVPIIGLGVILVVLVIAYLIGLALKIDRPTIGGIILAAGFGNTAFIGYPVIQSALGKNALMPAALYDELAMAFPLYTLGMVIAASFAGEKVDRKQLLKMASAPAVLAIPIALILRPYQLPMPILKTIGYLANATVALAMLSIGLSLSSKSIKGLAIPVLATCALKLAVLPFITYFAARAAGITGLNHTVTVLQAGMPSAVMSCVVASKFGANQRFVAAVVFISTLLSIITIPLTLLILDANP